MRKKYNRNWDKIYAEYLESDLSQSEYARLKSIPLSTLSKHFTKFNKLQVAQTEADSEISFLPVNINPVSSVSDSTISILYRDCSISLNPGFDKNTLRDIVGVLKECLG